MSGDLRRSLGRIFLAILAGGVAVHAIAGGGVASWLALAAALLAPVAIVAAVAPRSRRSEVALVALAASLVAVVVVVEGLHRRIAAGTGPSDAARGLAVLLLVAGVVPAVVLAWAFAPTVPRRDASDGHGERRT